ncbi:hypothetical protein HG537_0B04640 [Torulaspora globosa]|uniref:Crh-like protein n=1 Tax=Torulaspora globosa TaxID=48254 RepID=A0A7H9HPI8_9SACH|nr:hypothetical protein HG537_0B04640 [Torulaspora sp. CBS 2947]
MTMIKTVAILLALVSNVLAIETVICNATQSCPEELPCCSQFGECGTGSTCLGGCNPMFSFNAAACMPMAICQDSSTTFQNYSSRVASHDTYLGNVSEADWVYTGYLYDYDDEDSMLLAMPKYSAGTVLSSTRFMWYGKVSARLKSSHLGGVVSSFILFSNVQDEIDFEYVGADLKTVQSNFYFEGILNYNNSKNISTTDTFENYHDYEIDWHEDYITWSVDGVVGRTLYKNQTYNETSKRYEFPQTPSKVQLSLWPAGNATNAPGTIAWAGGEINWNADDLKDPGYYYASLQQVNITCYDPPSYAPKNGTKSYQFIKSDSFLSEDVAITDKDSFLYSDEGSGLDAEKGKNSSSIASSSSSSSSTSLSSSSISSSSSSSSSSSASSSSSKSTSTSKTTDKSTASSATVQTTVAAATKTTSLSSEQSTAFVQNIKSSSSGTSSKQQQTSTGTNGANAISVGIPLAGILLSYLL